MTTTANFGLPLIQSQQAQPEITANTSLIMLSALLTGVIDFGRNDPPAAVDGDAYVIGAAPTGTWAGQANKLAYYAFDYWLFIPGYDSDGTAIQMGAEQTGLVLFDRATVDSMRWNGAAWEPFAATSLAAADVSYDATAVGLSIDDVQAALDMILALPASRPRWHVTAAGTTVAQNIALPYADLTVDDVLATENGLCFDPIELSIAGNILTLTSSVVGGKIVVRG